MNQKKKKPLQSLEVISHICFLACNILCTIIVSTFIDDLFSIYFQNTILNILYACSQLILVT